MPSIERDPLRVLSDVVEGYISIDAAARDYGVLVRFLGAPHSLVRLPEHYEVDWTATQARRHG